MYRDSIVTFDRAQAKLCQSTLWSRGRIGFLILCGGGGARRLDHQVHRQTVLDVVCAECLVILHDFAGEDEAQLISLCVEFLGDRLLKLPAQGKERRRWEEREKEEIRDAENGTNRFDS